MAANSFPSNRSEQSTLKAISEAALREEWRNCGSKSFKINAFSKSPNAFQIGGLILWMLTLVYVILVLLATFEQLYLQMILLAIFVLSSILLFAFAVKLGLTDPTEPHSAMSQYFKKQGIKVIFEELEFYCAYCEAWVPPDVYHCRLCNRCVEHLDHHCIWVNNCVNKSNYKLFLRLVDVLLIYEAICIIFSIVAIVQICVFKRLLSRWTVVNSSVEVIVPSTLMIAIYGVCFILTVRLFFFHRWLVKHNLTTLEYIKKIKPKLSSSKVKPIAEAKPANIKDLKESGTPKVDDPGMKVQSPEDGLTNMKKSAQISLATSVPGETMMISSKAFAKPEGQFRPDEQENQIKLIPFSAKRDPAKPGQVHSPGLRTRTVQKAVSKQFQEEQTTPRLPAETLQNQSKHSK